MKKFIFLFITLTLFVGGSSFGGPYSSTSSMLIVIEKNYSQDFRDAWITAYDPYNSTREQSIKIMVEKPMVWNLIKVGNEYVATYDKKGNKPWVLEQIQYPGDEKTLR